MAPVISEKGTSAAVGAASGIAAAAERTGGFSCGELCDCRPIGVGDVIEGVAGAGITATGGAIGRRYDRERGVDRIFDCGGWRRGAAIQQRHRHPEGAEHNHDHACADQQRTNFRCDGRRFLGVRARPCSSFDGLGGLVIRRSRSGSLGGAAGGGNEIGLARRLRRAADLVSRLPASQSLRMVKPSGRPDGCRAREDDPAADRNRSLHAVAARHENLEFR